MNIIKLSEEQLREFFMPELLSRAEGSIGQITDCIIKDGRLHGCIKGNHGIYSIELEVSPKIHAKCSCKKGSEGNLCKHSAALGLTYIYTPWYFKCKDNIDRNLLKNTDDIAFYIAVTPLKQLLSELRDRNINASSVSDITRLPLQQIFAAVKDDDNNIPHLNVEMCKIACMYLLDKGVEQ